ncbi:hypothetical protein A1O3_06048 [Capronia epimyces CBS 606.96]|uniref:SAP domain-containing protein n=1 Tax=Capronia epimyces CBS 606.96 TaxID=1182542 RepID=W9XXX9_9EURO|nr:uncharacterized protein A1O3_06048 [Capronia epimyces CBS 606.96]EXJ82235.1 hypothetical protein A1O3_06048 [Capronia epimyces CBS 606.96]
MQMHLANANPLGPQPDANRIAQCYDTLGDELAKFPNIPALAEGNAIQLALVQLTTQINQLATQMNQLGTQINQRFDQVDERFDQVDERIDNLTTRVVANDHNSMSRVQNAHLSSADQRLIPLVNPTTNTPIEVFPRRSREIPSMENEALVSVLRELGLPTNGTREAKEKRIRQYIGLLPERSGA